MTYITLHEYGCEGIYKLEDISGLFITPAGCYIQIFNRTFQVDEEYDKIKELIEKVNLPAINL